MGTSVEMKELLHRLGKTNISGRLNSTKTVRTSRIYVNITGHRPVRLPITSSQKPRHSQHFSFYPASSELKSGDSSLTSHTGFVKPLRSGHRIEHKHKRDFHVANQKSRSNHGRDPQYTIDEQVQLSLLVVNRQINREADFGFWEKNTFILRPDDISMRPAMLYEAGLFTSSLNKIKHVQFDLDSRPSESFLQGIERKQNLETALRILEKMAVGGTLKELSMRPIFGLDNLETVIDQAKFAEESLEKVKRILQMFGESTENGQLDGIKRTVEIEIG